MKSYRIHCLKIRRYPLLKQLLHAMLYSWITIVGMCLVSIIILTFRDLHIKLNISEITSSFTLSCLFTTVYFLPINVYILLMIQFSGIIPFLMGSPLFVCIESGIFFATSITIDRFLFPNVSVTPLLSTVFVIGLSFIFMSYLKCKHNETFVTYKRIMRRLRSSYMINKEVDIFIILMILSILILIFLSWQ